MFLQVNTNSIFRYIMAKAIHRTVCRAVVNKSIRRTVRRAVVKKSNRHTRAGSGRHVFSRSRLVILKIFPGSFNIKALPTDVVEGLNKKGECSDFYMCLPTFYFIWILGYLCKYFLLCTSFICIFVDIIFLMFAHCHIRLMK